MIATASPPDIFAEAKARYTIFDVWPMLGLPGDPEPSCKSPFRDEKTASFSIYEDGRKWKDHGSGEGGDLIEFVRIATGWDHSEIREWFMERLGTDHRDPPTRPQKPVEPRKEIQWPCELLTGSEATWAAFAKLRGLSYPGVWTMVEAGLLRFGIVDGHKCFIVTDDQRRAAEIRRLDGGTFGTGRKAYPLKGVDKSRLVGGDFIAESPGHGWAIAEGASDFLHLLDLYVRYRRAGGEWSFLPMAILGAGMKTLCPEIMAEAAGRTIVLIPDADEAGDKMKAHWCKSFSEAGADVEAITLPRGKDLRDVAAELEPGDLFNE